MSDASADPYWDCNVSVGRRSGRRYAPAQEVTATSLLDEMDRLGVSRAMVHHVLAHELAPAVGNDRILAEVDGRPRLFPVWVVMPEHTGELPPAEDLVAALIRQGVRMARMFPSAELSGHRFSLADWSAGSLLRALADCRIPLLLDFTLFRRGEPPWDSIVDVCTRFPDLPVLLVDVQGRNNRTLYPLLSHCPNPRVDTGGLNVHRGIEDVVRRFGAERLVFGSGYPLRPMGGALLQVQRAEISREERRLIAFENLRSLVSGVDTSVVTHVH